MSEEKCVRCGVNGHDRRTLWMACMYEMSELSVPFGDAQIKGKLMKHDGTEHLGWLNRTIQKFADDPEAQEFTKHFYTLRVCKSCRAEWLQAIQTWFHADTQGDDDAIEHDGPVAYRRHFGANRPMTQEECAEWSFNRNIAHHAKRP